MANITRFDPFADFTALRPFGDIEEFMKNFNLRPFRSELEPQPRITVDVTEQGQDYLVKAEIPGVRKEDIHVAIEGNTVSIEAEVKRDTEEKAGGKVVRSERYFGRQYRSFALASELDAAKAQARYQDGVLELTLPRKGNGSAKEVKIQ